MLLVTCPTKKHLESISLQGSAGETYLRGEIRARGTCTVSGCHIIGKNKHPSKPHSRRLLKVGVRALPFAHLILKNVVISNIQGYGLFVGPTARVTMEESCICNSLMCNAYLATGATVGMSFCKLYGVCWGIECREGVSLHLYQTSLSHTGLYNLKVSEGTNVSYTRL